MAQDETKHSWIEVTTLLDTERRFICGHCDATKTEPFHGIWSKTPDSAKGADGTLN